MKARLTSILKNSLTLSVTLMLAFSLFISAQDGPKVVNAAGSMEAQTQTNTPLISQGEVVHYSTLKGEDLSFTLNVEDASNSGIFTWQIQAPARSGTVTLAPNGSEVEVQYSPAEGFTGEDLFSIVVSDQAGNF